jgi:hypothetical protein
MREEEREREREREREEEGGLFHWIPEERIEAAQTTRVRPSCVIEARVRQQAF